MRDPDTNDFDARAEQLADFVRRLVESEAAVDAICADGWPRAMARRGLDMHRETWRVDEVVEVVRRELAPFGGAAGLEGSEIIAPGVISHIWPALPGAGLTPVLFGYLLGAEQRVKPSSRGSAFAQHIVDIWGVVVGHGLDLCTSTWWDADVVVVSGSDQTVRDVRDIAEEQSDGRAHVTGYGHRVSFAVVEDRDELDISSLARDIAVDIVMWHQAGCFSCRSVVFAGSEDRCDHFCASLGRSISDIEEELDAADVGEAELARRAQARGTAEFSGRVWGDGVGWVTRPNENWEGDAPSIHAVTVHRIGQPDDLAEVIDVPSRHLQGVALSVLDSSRAAWSNCLAELGVTRICEPGSLQQPPASWPHDGRPNILEWVRLVGRDDR